MTAYIGVDPGLGGAVALYDPDVKVLLLDMPLRDGLVDGKALGDWLSVFAVIDYPLGVHAFVENVSSRPRQAGAFNFGVSTGIVHGVLGALGIPTTLLSPTKWKTEMGLKRRPNESQAENKTRARALAAQLFPTMADQFKRVKDDGRAEALLMAVYAANKGE